MPWLSRKNECRESNRSTANTGRHCAVSGIQSLHEDFEGCSSRGYFTRRSSSHGRAAINTNPLPAMQTRRRTGTQFVGREAELQN